MRPNKRLKFVRPCFACIFFQVTCCIKFLLLFLVLDLPGESKANPTLSDANGVSTADPTLRPSAQVPIGLDKEQVFKKEPWICNLHDGVAELRVYPVTESLQPQVSNYFVIVELFDFLPKVFTQYNVSYDQALAQELPYYATYRLEASEIGDHHDIKVGDDSDRGIFRNPRLQNDRYYRFGVAAQLNNGSFRFIRSSRSVILLENRGKLIVDRFLILFASVLTILLIVVVGLLLYLKQASIDIRWRDILMVWSERHRSSLLKDRNRERLRNCNDLAMPEKSFSVQSDQNRLSAFPGVDSTIKHHVIHVNHITNFLKQPDSKDVIEKEFLSVPTKFSLATLQGRSESNRPKNRYNDSLPYDHNRVILRRPHSSKPSEHGSDYINASYIDGFYKSPRYIATQGPMENTLFDFWYMVWTQNSSQIVMLTALEDNGKKKCHKYWPQSGELTLNNLQITFLDQQEHPDLTIRRFSLAFDGHNETRQVVQYHHTAWPDNGTPENIEAFMELIQRIKSDNIKAEKSDQGSAGPLIVHCSAGIGRTGTYMMIDCMVDKAKKEANIDLLGQLFEFRKQRACLIENSGQYEFAYKAVGHYCEAIGKR